MVRAEERNGLIHYYVVFATGRHGTLREAELNDALQFGHPQERRGLGQGERTVKKLLPELLAEAEPAMRTEHADELERLQALAGINPNVRSEEITTLQRRALKLTGQLSLSGPRLDAVHLFVAL